MAENGQDEAIPQKAPDGAAPGNSAQTADKASDSGGFYRRFGKVALHSFAACILYIGYVSAKADMFQNSDYISCIYVGAKLFAEKRFGELYAPYNATVFSGAPCDLFAHKLLPHLAPMHTSLFNYSPLLAFLIAPLSCLSPSDSLLVWEALSVVCLSISVFVLVDGWQRRLMILSASLLFMPISVTIWIGQMDLVLGVIFFALGYRLLMKDKPLPAGFVFGLSFLKPQMIILPALISFVLLLKKEWKFFAGFILGIAAIVGGCILVGGVDLFKQWLWNVRLCEKVFTDPKAGLSQYLIIGVPGVILLKLLKEPVPWIKLAIYAVNALIGLWTAYLCLRYAKYTPNSKAYLGYMMIIGLLVMCIVIPNYLYYDLSTLIVAFCIMLDPEFEKDNKPVFYLLMGVSMVVFTIYGILFMSNAKLALSAVPMIVMVAMYARVALIALQKRPPAN